MTAFEYNSHRLVDTLANYDWKASKDIAMITIKIIAHVETHMHNSFDFISIIQILKNFKTSL